MVALMDMVLGSRQDVATDVRKNELCYITIVLAM